MSLAEQSTPIPSKLTAAEAIRSMLDERDRLGYEANPQQAEEFRPWEDVAAWPDD
ncbi:MAG TPA: hypothetical protein VFB63_33075 [Bryobacteraceae bacterium]|nr:hypothetical protein [Bryobacteraceae bacterium]